MPRVSQLIEALRAFQEEYGDVPVDTFCINERVSLAPPTAAYRKILRTGEIYDDFWYRSDGISRRGELVCKLTGEVSP